MRSTVLFSVVLATTLSLPEAFAESINVTYDITTQDYGQAYSREAQRPYLTGVPDDEICHDLVNLFMGPQYVDHVRKVAISVGADSSADTRKTCGKKVFDKNDHRKEYALARKAELKLNVPAGGAIFTTSVKGQISFRSCEEQKKSAERALRGSKLAFDAQCGGIAPPDGPGGTIIARDLVVFVAHSQDELDRLKQIAADQGGQIEMRKNLAARYSAASAQSSIALIGTNGAK
jgi:hypothetical protein